MLGQAMEMLPNYILRRLAKANGKWNRGNYRGCRRCLVGHAGGSRMASCGRMSRGRYAEMAEMMPEALLIKRIGIKLTGRSNGYAGGEVEEHYMYLSERFGDVRVGRAIEKRASRILARRATEQDLSCVPSAVEKEALIPV